MGGAASFQADYIRNGSAKIAGQEAHTNTSQDETDNRPNLIITDDEERLIILRHRQAKLKQDPLAPEGDDSTPSEESAPQSESASKQSQATRLARLAERSGCELWTTLEGEPYITFSVSGHKEHHPLKAKATKSWLERLYYVEEKGVANTQAVQEALGVLRGKALFEGSQHALFIRVARHASSGYIYLDLSNDKWQAIEIAQDGWSVTDDPPVRFKRTKGMQALPIPLRNGHLSELRAFVNVADDEAWVLLTAFLVAALWPEGPYPLLAPVGEQGTAKTTLVRLLKSLVDPSVSATRAEPGNKHDLAIAASSGWLLGYDNLSSIPNWLSDSLCRLSTGGGFATRELYTTDEEAIFDAMRPIALTAIEEVITRGDLLDRCIVLNLVPIPDGKRRPESELWRDFERVRPRVLGALLDALSAGMRNLPSVRLSGLPRMADFAKLIVACETALGHKSGAFMQAYMGNRADANSLALDTPIVNTLIAFIAERHTWVGAAGELLKELDHLAGYAGSEGYKHAPKDWPRSPRALAGLLRRLAPNLRQGAGITVSFERDNDKTRKRLIQVEKTDAQSSEPSDNQTVLDAMDGADDSDGYYSDVFEEG